MTTVTTTITTNAHINGHSILQEYTEYHTMHKRSVHYVQYSTVYYRTALYSIWTLKSVQCAQTSSQSYNIIQYGTDFKAHILPVYLPGSVKHLSVFDEGRSPERYRNSIV